LRPVGTRCFHHLRGGGNPFADEQAIET